MRCCVVLVYGELGGKVANFYDIKVSGCSPALKDFAEISPSWPSQLKDL